MTATRTPTAAEALLNSTRDALSATVDNGHATWTELANAGAPAAERDLARDVLFAALAAKAAFMSAMGLDS